MTCFWDGILTGLKREPEIWNHITQHINQTITNQHFINFCKQNCHILKEKYEYIRWNNDKIREQEINEHHIPLIKDLNESGIGGGYLCATCDSFLLFLCCYFELNIFHNYNSHTVAYLYEKPDIGSKKNKSLFVQSDKGHFWFISYVA
jgi:hypothetical protein